MTRDAHGMAADGRATGRRPGPIGPLLAVFSSIPLGLALLAAIGLYLAAGSMRLDLIPGFSGAEPGAFLYAHPSLDRSAGEYFGAWPLRTLIALFILNMIVATVRRIPATLPNAGVLTAHAGVALIAAGSFIYAHSHHRGELLLSAAEDGSLPGPEEHSYADADAVELVLSNKTGASVFPLRALPRRHDAGVPWSDRPMPAVIVATHAGRTARIVSYAAYAELTEAPLTGRSAPAAARWTLALEPDESPLIRFGLTADDPAEAAFEFEGIARIEHASDPRAALLRTPHEPGGPAQVFLSGSEAIVRTPGGAVQTIPSIEPGGRIRLNPVLTLYLESYEHGPPALRTLQPVPVPAPQRRPEFTGNRRRAAIGVSFDDDPTAVVWVPFSVGGERERRIRLGEEEWRLAFRPARRALEAHAVSLLAFDPGTATATLRIARAGGAPYDLAVSPNRPIVLHEPSPLTISIAGWNERQWGGDAPLAPEEAYVLFTVATTPGIRLVALGGVLIGLGMPWAFFIKPLLLGRGKA